MLLPLMGTGLPCEQRGTLSASLIWIKRIAGSWTTPFHDDTRYFALCDLCDVVRCPIGRAANCDRGALSCKPSGILLLSASIHVGSRPNDRHLNTMAWGFGLSPAQSKALPGTNQAGPAWTDGAET
jgi:hypothetical protein